MEQFRTIQSVRYSPGTSDEILFDEDLISRQFNYALIRLARPAGEVEQEQPEYPAQCHG